MRRCFLALAPILLAATLAAIAAPTTQPKPDLGHNASFRGSRLVPPGSEWTRDVSRDPVDRNSDAIIASIGRDKPLHPDFGTTWQGNPCGIPYVVVDAAQKKVPITFTDYGDESDPGPYPVPADAPIEGGPKSDGDRHVLVYDRDSQVLYELFRAFPNADGSWKAACGAVFDLKNPKSRPAGWTSADAAGLPILPGLVRWDEVSEQKELTHAVRFTVRNTRRAYVAPASHFASRKTDANLPPMGMRVRLRADFDVRSFPPEAQIILRGLKTHGMILADNGSDWFISGSPHPKWNDEALATLKRVKGRDFQVLEMKGLVTK